MPWWSAIVGPFRPWSALIEGKPNLNLPLSNGSVTLVEYEDGALTVKVFGDSSYREVGESLQES